MRALTQALPQGEILVCLGLARHAQGKDATAAFESASRVLPDDAEVHYLLAQALETQGKLERAAESLARTITLAPEHADAHNDLGRVLLGLGRIEAAIASCRRALELRPRFAAALGNLANAERARGDLRSAIAGYRQVIELEPGLAEAHRSLGNALFEAGELEAASESWQRTLELKPDDAVALTQLGRALSTLDRAAEAIPHYERLLARAPRADVMNDYGVLLIGLGRFEPAARVLRDALARAPRDARLHANLAHTLHCLGDHRGAVASSRRALELDTRLPEAYLHLGNALLAINEMHAAEATYRAGLKGAPENIPLLSAHAMAERALGRVEAAESSARRAHALRPQSAEVVALLGSLAIDRGRFEEAEARLKQALELRPDLPEALIALSAVRRMSAADASWRDAVLRVLARPLPVPHAIALHHALGKYHDETGEIGAAFEQHRRGHELARRSRPAYDRGATSARVRRACAVFDREALASIAQAADGAASERAVFVCGMPRSGTTLAEQILASHPAIHGAGEVLFWQFAADAEISAPPEQRAQLISKLGRQYLAAMSSFPTTAIRVIDKLPSNFKNLGLIHTALPRARFIHLERHPLDTCLSIYFQGFSAAHAYASDLEDLAHYYREYLRLMAHWRTVLPPETLLEVPYEALVDEPESWSRRMLEHVGLPWDERCLEFHRTERPVFTASNWQVRQPISKTSIGRWRPYERLLAPLIEALGDEVLEPWRARSRSGF